jgi:hypothetical protein
MIDRLAAYHTALRSTGSSGYPNMSYQNPMHQQQPFPLGGVYQPLSDPYQRLLNPTYPQQPIQTIGIPRRRRRPYYF